MTLLRPIRTENEQALLQAVRQLLGTLDAMNSAKSIPIRLPTSELRALLAKADQEEGK
jgi:hypothetical protein